MTNKVYLVLLFLSSPLGVCLSWGNTFVDVDVTGALDVSNSFYTTDGRIVLRSQNTVYEGGEIHFSSPSPYVDWGLDSYQGSMRFYHSGTVYFQLFSSGNLYLKEKLGIGIPNPSVDLVLKNTRPNLALVSEWNEKGMRFEYHEVEEEIRVQAAKSTGGYDSLTIMTVQRDGLIGIGTNSPIHKLDVNGTARAKEIIVESNWADFVFEEDYELMPLEEVAEHIEREKRLPGVRSAEEIQAEGASVGETQAMLLQKVEELTLYVIELNEEVKSLREENRSLRSNP